MVYKIDNRPKKHRGRYATLGFFLGIAVCFVGLYFYYNYWETQPVIQSVAEIKRVVTDVVTPVVHHHNNVVTTLNNPPQVSDNVQLVQNDQIQSNPVQQVVPQSNTPDYSLEQLRQVALDDINNYRVQNGLRPIPMDNAKASQVWADHLLTLGCITHREGIVGPNTRYKDNGDKPQMVYENVSGGYGTTWMTPPEAIKQANYDMMFNDADQNNGHKNNILNPNHQSVSLGISYNSGSWIN